MSIENAAVGRSRAISLQSASLPQSDVRSTRFIAEDAATCRLLQQAEIVAPHLRLAIIEGESGVGKESFARHLYTRASVANPRLQTTGFSRCDAREWLLSETHPQTMTGFFYLDRVDLLAAPGQALLLRALKKLNEWPSASLMMVASSEVSLRDLAVRGLFLPELAFRLAAIRFTIPPLRERPGDIGPLAAFLLDRICLRYRLRPFTFATEALDRIADYEWPGNVRELATVLESAVVGCTGSVIRTEDIALHATHAFPHTAPSSKVLNLDAAIRDHVRYVLELNRGNKLRTARQLGISRSTLYRMLESGPSFVRQAAP